MKRSMLLSAVMLFYAVPSSALTLTRENVEEIDMRWRAIFDGELVGQTLQTPTQLLERYKKHLLDFNEEDVVLAEQLIVRLCQGDLWNLFVQRKDKDTVLAYIDMLTTALQRYISSECCLRFPPKLDELAYSIRASDLSEIDYCTKLRRAFLAFTIIVSKMNYIAQQ